MADKVLCRFCGYLGVRHPVTGKTIEATEQVLNRCMITVERDNTYFAEFICRKNVKVFSLNRLSSADAIHNAIHAEFECPQFQPRHVGKTPEEHEQMSLIAELEQRTQEWRREDLEWQRQVDAKAEQRHTDNRKDFRWYLLLTFLIGVGTVASATIALFALFKSNNVTQAPLPAAEQPAISAPTATPQ